MKRLIEYFDRTYIINLKDRPDRRLFAEREFNRIGIEIPSTKVRFYDAVRPLDKGVFHQIGARGTFTSHRDILSIANKDGLRNVLVLEDDVSFRSIDEKHFESLIAKLSQNQWDIIYFGYLVPSDDNLVGPLLPWVQKTLGGHFYGVNGIFLSKMLQYMNECVTRPRDHPDGGPMGRDGAFNHVRIVYPDTRVFISVPNLALQRSARTDVHPLKGFDKIVFLRPLIERARANKHRVIMALDKLKLRSRRNK